MQRYFAINSKLELSKKDIYHIIKVMRMKVNDKIEVVYDRCVNLCNIDFIDSKEIKISIIKKIKEDNELKSNITIAFSLVSESKIDLILQKCTELGCYNFIPLKVNRSKIKLDSKEEKKLMRWNLITKEAAEQSHRNIIPNVTNIMSINDIINLDYDVKLLCSPKEKEKTIKNVLQKYSKYDKIIIVVGPEGGLDSIEEDLLIKNNFECISLGQTILRTETAPIFVMSALKYEFMR